MAFAITLTFNHEINTSLQVGDQVYHTGTTPLGGFDQNNFDFGTSRWHSDASYEGDSFFLVGTQEESSDFYKDLIKNGYSVQDKYNLGEKK